MLSAALRPGVPRPGVSCCCYRLALPPLGVSTTSMSPPPTTSLVTKTFRISTKLCLLSCRLTAQGTDGRCGGNVGGRERKKVA